MQALDDKRKHTRAPRDANYIKTKTVDLAKTLSTAGEPKNEEARQALMSPNVP